MPRKCNDDVLIGVPDRELNKNIKKITKLRPLQVRRLLREAKHQAGTKGDVDDAFQRLYRERVWPAVM
jgi:hypothetical protein